MTDLARERRVLVLTPTGQDATLARSVLARAGVACEPCRDLEQLCDELDAGASAVLVAEEAVEQDHGNCLARWLARQPPWSDLPVLLLARPGADSSAVVRAIDVLGNVTVLERPMRVAALVSAVRTALRARERQYQIRESLAERERAEAALREADRRKDEFLAILAHELRNPLAPLRNSIHIQRLTNRNDPTAKRLLDMMERQVDHMVRLVDDLLEISRITRDRIELRVETVDVATAVRSAVETSHPLIDAQGHELELAVPREPLLLEGDPVRLAQIFANLLNNAAKYTDPGGKIRLAVQREGDAVTISVQDTGVGIPADMLPRVFDLFTQVDQSAGRVHGGLGIGLTLVKRLVEMHRGSITARSAGPGQGCEFVVRLPLSTARPSGAPERDARPPSLARRSVLVVDDNRDAAESLGVLLAVLGADARVACSGAEALAAIPTHRPSVVLLDIGMPGMDGYEVAKRIREDPQLHDVTLVALTGWGQEEDRRRTREAGFDHHLVKPADVTALKTLLGSLEAGSEREGGRTSDPAKPADPL